MDQEAIDKMNEVNLAGLRSLNAKLLIEQYYRIVLRLESHNSNEFPKVPDQEIMEIAHRRSSKSEIHAMLLDDVHRKIKEIDIAGTLFKMDYADARPWY